LLRQVSFHLGPNSILTDLASGRPPWRFLLFRPAATGRVGLAVRAPATPTIEAWVRDRGAFHPLQPIRASTIELGALLSSGAGDPR